MKSKVFALMGYRRLAALCAIALPALTGCAKENVPVSIHGVNYTAQEFTYTIVDPNNKKNFGGGELIAPFSAGGTMCCYELPTKWRAGIQVQINGTHWLPEKPDGSLPEVKETKLVEVPRYVDGKPGELWVLRGADGTLSLVSSDYQPDHAKWPGKVKGWPVPSREYQRERWDLYINHEQGYVRLYEKFLKELQSSPKSHAEESWAYSKEREPTSLARFSGPQDSEYLAYLRRSYEDGLKEAQTKLKELKERRP